MWVDDLAGTVHRAYGGLPNMTFVLYRGRIVYRSDWTEERSLRAALEHWLWEREQEEAGAPLARYHVEWAPRRVRDRARFLEAMHTEVGRRAVEEFIAAVEHAHGEAAARPLRTWWEERGDG
ncbi:MAG: hypothetical protein ACQEXJ_16825 [Myxococcota bacterium]